MVSLHTGECMNIDALLSRLEKVKKTGNGKWIACCPAHADRSPSLAIKEADGTILLHCFSGCGVDEVLDALGIPASDLFPPRERSEHAAKGKPSFDAYQALKAIADDINVLLVANRMVIKGEKLTESDTARLTASAGRLLEARGFVLGRTA